MANKLWRLFFTLVLTVLTAVMGWNLANVLLDPTSPLGGYFQDKVWATPLYRGVFSVCCTIFGVAIGRAVFHQIELLGDRIGSMSARDKLALISGVIIGLVLTAVLSIPLILVTLSKSLLLTIALPLMLGVVVTYLSTVATLSMKEEIRLYIPPKPEAEEGAVAAPENFKILDTNVIIDGRIADVVRAGFIEGPIYIPGFVLDELQHIADSSDSLKRVRGRRGLNILNAMQKEFTLEVRTYDKLVPGYEEVDGKLVRLAKAMNGSIVTNDFNLNKVAELQGVTVLNINELANALKPVVLPGEEMTVAIVKEGKEAAQGVAYLDDGTMIVVEGGRRHMGETVDVQVASVLQTQAGKMIFAHMADDESEGGDNLDRGGMRSYSGRRPRRAVR